MNITEKELEDCIWDAITKNKYNELAKNGFYLDFGATFYRQFNFTPYGVCDLCSVRFSKDDYSQWHAHVNIYELKKDTVNEDTFLQAIRYAKAVQMMAVEWNTFHARKNWINIHINIHLIGKSVKTTNEFIYLTDIFDNVFFYKYKIDIVKGVSFIKECDYVNSSNEKPKIPKFSKSLFKK